MPTATKSSRHTVPPVVAPWQVPGGDPDGDAPPLLRCERCRCTIYFRLLGDAGWACAFCAEDEKIADATAEYC